MPEDVVEYLGVRPDQVVDFKALVGDKSDNIPGVAGVGEKTAISLLQSYGSLDGIYAHVEEISGSLHNKLEAGRERGIPEPKPRTDCHRPAHSARPGAGATPDL